MLTDQQEANRLVAKIGLPRFFGRMMSREIDWEVGSTAIDQYVHPPRIGLLERIKRWICG